MRRVASTIRFFPFPTHLHRSPSDNLLLRSIWPVRSSAGGAWLLPKRRFLHRIVSQSVSQPALKEVAAALVSWAQDAASAR